MFLVLISIQKSAKGDNIRKNVLVDSSIRRKAHTQVDSIYVTDFVIESFVSTLIELLKGVLPDLRASGEWGKHTVLFYIYVKDDRGF